MRRSASYDGETGAAAGIILPRFVVEAAEQRHAVADLVEREDAGVEAVVEIGGEVGDLVGEVDELRFERRKCVEEVFGQLRMRRKPSSRASA